jgi:deoxyribonuclease V
MGGRGVAGTGRALDPAEVAFFAGLQTILFRKKERLPNKVSMICAVDAAYHGDRVAAAASVFHEGQLVEKSSYAGSCSLSYLSGLFYLREGPFVTEVVRRLNVRPQLLCFDAHGAAHPRSAGLATIAGMIVGIPSVGIAKSLLVGVVASGGGGLDRIVYDGKTVGFVTRMNGVARYWSAGYSIGLGRLECLARRYAPICLRAMSESDRTAREQIRAATVVHRTSDSVRT